MDRIQKISNIVESIKEIKTNKPTMKLGDGYEINEIVVTGRLYRSNKRFRQVYPATVEGYRTAMMINLWNGSVWGVNTSFRKLLKRVNN